MKILYLKKWKYLVVFLWAMLSVASAFSQDLNVSGISNPSEANGTYTLTGTYSGYSYWSLTVGATTYVIYNDVYSTSSGTSRYWNLDTDFMDEGTKAVLFYSSASTDNSPAGLSYSADAGAGSLNITTGTPTPDIAILGDGNAITDGSTAISSVIFTNIGSASISGGTVSRTFTIKNTGSAALTLSGSSPYVIISGANASSFSVSAAPDQSIAASTGTTTFTITFTPLSQGYHNAVVTINSNDPDDESVYTFNIQGYGFVAQSLVISGITEPTAANGTYIHQGVINNFQYWKHQTLNYYLYFDTYSGSGYWDIDNNTIDDDNGYFYKASEDGTPVGLISWIVGALGSPPVPAGAPVISPAVLAPEINLKGNSISIATNDITPSFADHTKFGSVNVTAIDVTGSRTRTYTIENSGGAALTISGITLGGADASEFSKTDPVLTTIPALGSTTFTVTFDPSTEGTKTATISIANDDADENPYVFTISGDAFIPKNLIVSDIATPPAANGSYIYQGILNESQYWKHESQEYYIFNDEYTNAYYWNIDVDLTDTDNDYLFLKNSEAVAPVGFTSWTANTNAGYISTGAPTIVYAGPEMEVRGNGTVIIDGDASPSTSDYTDFGSISAASGVISHTFTINNLGYGSLNLNGTPIVAKSGTNASDFTITQPSSTTLDALTGTISFTVQFDPSGGGVRTAEISIANDDSDENPYHFSIQGTGFAVPTVTSQAVTKVGSTNAVGNGNITDLGNPTAITSYGICYGTSANPDIDGSKVDKGATSATGAFTAQITGLTAETTYHVRAFVTNSEGTSYGDDLTFTTSSVLTEPGNALSFDGTNDFVAVPFATTSLSSFTIETWINPATIPETGNVAILNTNTWDATNGGIHFQFEGGFVSLAIYELGSGWPTMNTKLATNRWQHIAVVYNGASNEVKFYLNGVLNNTVSKTLPVTKIGAAEIGAWGSDRYLNGKLDEFRVWNKALTESEIQVDMNHGILASTSGLMAYYNFNEGTAGADNTAGSILLPDLTSNGNNGTLTNFALTGNTSNWVESYAMVVPTVAAATNAYSISFRANWTAPEVGAVENYLLEVATDAAFTNYVPGYSPQIVASPAVLSSVTGLTSNTTYYYRVRADKASVTGQSAWSETQMASTVYPTSSMFRTDGVWSNPGNWSSSLPGPTTDVMIQANCTMDGDNHVKSMVIGADKVLTIAPNQTLTVDNAIENNSGVSGFIIESDATGTGKLVNNTTNVDATIKQYLIKDQWHYMGIPVTTLPDANNVYHNCYVVTCDETLATTGTETGWNYIKRGDALIPMTGYGVQYNRASTDNDTTIVFSGTLNTGNLSINTTAAGDGWNLIGNPYPCTIDWDQLKATGLSNVEDAIYVYDPISSDYATYIVGVQGGASTQGQNIAPMQGFFVHALAAGSVSFTNGAKTASASIFKDAVMQTILRLKLSDSHGASDESVIRINAQATDAFDSHLDAYKLKATASMTPQLYSVYNGVEYSINSIAEVTDQTVIPFEIMIKQAGKHTVSMTELTGYNEALPIVLFDENGQVLANLQSGDYSFEAQTGDLVKFKLAFNNMLTSTEINRNRFITISVQDRNMKITGLGNEISEVWLYNINGQLLRSHQVQGNVFNMTNLNPGVHLLKVKDSAGLISVKKVVIN